MSCKCKSRLFSVAEEFINVCVGITRARCGLGCDVKSNAQSETRYDKADIWVIAE